MTLDTYGSLFDEDLEDLADRMQGRYGPGRGDNVVRLQVIEQARGSGDALVRRNVLQPV